MSRGRRIVITVCPRERGAVALPLEPGGPRVRLDARGVAKALDGIIERRGSRDRVRVESGCAGGCSGPGPNVSLAFYAMPRPGEPPDNVALAWRSYVASLATLSCLARVIDENLEGGGSDGDAGVRPVNESGERGAPWLGRVRPRTRGGAPSAEGPRDMRPPVRRVTSRSGPGVPGRFRAPGGLGGPVRVPKVFGLYPCAVSCTAGPRDRADYAEQRPRRGL